MLVETCWVQPKTNIKHQVASPHKLIILSILFDVQTVAEDKKVHKLAKKLINKQVLGLISDIIVHN